MPERPHVLFVAAMGGLGGPVRRLSTLLPHLRNVDITLVKPRSELLDERIRHTPNLRRYIALSRSAQHDRVGSLIIAYRVLRVSMNRANRPDVIHANGLVEFALSWPAAFITRRPVVTWVGNYEVPGMVSRLSRVFRPIARRTTWCAVSSLAATVIEEAGLVDAENVHVITNIVDPRDLEPTLPPEPVEEGVVRIAYLQVARWEKGFDLLRPIMDELSDLGGKVRLLVYGNPRRGSDGWDDLLTLDQAVLQVRARTGDVGNIYQNADIVLSPSRRESFNRVVAEALAAGVPVVAADLPPVVDVIGDAGLLFRSGDPVDAARALRRLIQDEGLRQSLGMLGRERSRSWAPRPVAERFETFYRGTRSGGPGSLL